MLFNEPADIGTILSIAEGESVPAFDTDAMERAHQYAVAAGEHGEVYGRTTGVGANKDVELDESSSTNQDLRLFRSHATAYGPQLDRRTARAAAAVRLHQLLQGGSGIDPSAAGALARALDADDLTAVHRDGSMGIGDLSQLAELALGLIGEVSGAGPAQWRPTGGDALPFLSSNAFTVAGAAVCVDRVSHLLGHHLRTIACSVVACGASRQPYAPAAQRANPHRGRARVAAYLNTLLEGYSGASSRLQDTFGFRCATQVAAPVVDQIAQLREAVEIEINSAPENPLVDADSGSVIHNGNFDILALAIPAQTLAVALVSAADLSLSRIRNLSSPEVTGGNPFLADATPGSSGTMITEYVAATALARMRVLAQPVTTGAVVVSRGMEDHASFATLAVQNLAAALDDFRTITATELLCAGRALAQLRDPEFVRGIPNVHDYVEAAPLSSSMADRPLTPDIAAIGEFLDRPIPPLRGQS